MTDEQIAHQKKAFLQKYSEVRSITNASRAVKVSRMTIFRWAQDDVEFGEAVRDIKFEVAEAIESASMGKAMNGKSDLLAIFLLKNLMPEQYRELIKHEVDHKVVVDISIQLAAVIKRVIPNTCPGCKTHLGLQNKIAEELTTLSLSMAGAK